MMDWMIYRDRLDIRHYYKFFETYAEMLDQIQEYPSQVKFVIHHTGIYNPVFAVVYDRMQHHYNWHERNIYRKNVFDKSSPYSYWNTAIAPDGEVVVITQFDKTMDDDRARAAYFDLDARALGTITNVSIKDFPVATRIIEHFFSDRKTMFNGPFGADYKDRLRGEIMGDNLKNLPMKHFKRHYGYKMRFNVDHDCYANDHANYVEIGLKWFACAYDVLHGLKKSTLCDKYGKAVYQEVVGVCANDPFTTSYKEGLMRDLFNARHDFPGYSIKQVNEVFLKADNFMHTVNLESEPFITAIYRMDEIMAKLMPPTESLQSPSVRYIFKK